MKNNLKNDCPKDKLVNAAGSSVTVCDDCGIFLKKSKWRNITVFQSISNSWYDGFLCVRCMAKSALAKERFVNKVKRENPFGEMIVKKVPSYGYYCNLDKHEMCINSYIDCNCECHQSNS